MKNYLHFLLALGLVFAVTVLFGRNTKLNTTESGKASLVYATNTVTNEDILEDHPNQYFIKFCPGTSQAAVKATLSELNSVELWKNERIGLRLWAVKSLPYICEDGEITDIDTHVKKIRNKSDVAEATVDQVYLLSSNSQNNGNSHFDELNLYEMPGGNKVKISILDSGISDAAIASNNSLNYVFGPTNYTGYDYIDNDPKPDDLNGHGTQIAGIIYNIINHQGNVSNVSFDIRKTHGQDGRGNISDLVAATVDAVDAGANIINMSFSYIDAVDNTLFDPLGLAIEYAREHGVLVVASAGNNANNNDVGDVAPFPATLTNENVLSVGSNNPLDELSYFSNYGGNSVDVSILGENIPSPGLDGNVEYISGTSFSTAIVTALSAVLGTRQDQFNFCEIQCILINTSQPVQGMNGLNASGGVINFNRALNNPPSTCGLNCPDLDINTTVEECEEYCPPETTAQNTCAVKDESVTEQFIVYDIHDDPISFSTDPVYGPFNGDLIIFEDGTFTYTSVGGGA